MFEIVAMTREDALVISHWQYEGEYEMYNFEETQELLNELTDGSYFACYHQENGLVGYFCFGNSARIPLSDEEQSVYQKQLLDIGWGIDPQLCGQGKVMEFMKAGLTFARQQFHADGFRLTVASFNQRAIKLYQKIGFVKTAQVSHRCSKMAFDIMEYRA